MRNPIQVLGSIALWITGLLFILYAVMQFENGHAAPGLLNISIGILLLPPVGTRVLRLVTERNFKGSTIIIHNYKFSPITIEGHYYGISPIINSIDFADRQNILGQVDYQLQKLTNKPSSAKLQMLGINIYLRMLEYTTRDLSISPEDMEALDKIQKYFNLSDKTVVEIKSRIKHDLFSKLMRKSYSDNILTEDEKVEMYSFAEFLGVPYHEITKLRQNIASSLINAIVYQKLKDGLLTPKEESEIKQVLRDLEIDDKDFKTIVGSNSYRRLAFAKLSWQLEKGIFTPMANAPVNTKRGEECYLAFDAKLWEEKSVHLGYESISAGLSIPVVKGIRYRVGKAKTAPVHKNILMKHAGTIVLTNQRVVFSAGKHSFQIPFDKLLAFDVFRNGMEFALDSKSYFLEFSNNNQELFATGLASSLRNYLDDENDVKEGALFEQASNEKLI